MARKSNGNTFKPPFTEDRMPEHLRQLIGVVRKTTDPEMLHQFISLNDEYHTRMRAEIAGNGCALGKTIALLLRDPSPIVIMAAIRHKTATIDGIELLMRHENAAVRSASASRIAELRDAIQSAEHQGQGKPE